VSKGLVAVTAALAGLVWAAAGVADVSFSDPAGDQKAALGGGAEVANAAPDITRIDVSNGQDGVVTFRVTIANYRDLPANAFLAIFFDLDRNDETGDLGDEAQIGWTSAGGVIYERWDGERMVRASTESVLAGFSEGIFTVAVHRAALDGVASFDFLVGSSARVNELLATDIAPVLGEHWTYHLVLGALTLRASSLTSTPARPVAGKRFVVSTAVTRSDTRTTVRSGSVTCAARVGGSTIRARGAFAAGRAQCALTVPKSAAEKLLRGTLTVRLEGASVRRSYSFRVATR
jgi:hypothetical protein